MLFFLNFSQLGLQLDTIPIFNNDCNPCLPGYITRAEQPSIADSVDQYQKQFNDKVVELSSKCKVLREPKIKSTNHYCNVCQAKFYDYLDHINSQSHKQRFRGNKFISKIQKECTPQSALRSPNVVALLDDGHETEPHLVKKRMTNDKQGNSFKQQIQQLFKVLQIVAHNHSNQIKAFIVFEHERMKIIIQMNNQKVQQILCPTGLSPGISGLYIGNTNAAKDNDTLVKYGINMILTVENKQTVKFDGNEQVVFHKVIPIDIEYQGYMHKPFYDAYMFITKGMEMGNVLMHCSDAKYISPVFAVAFLLQQQNLTVEQAWDSVKQQNPEAEVKSHFFTQLLKYERTLNLDKVLGEKSRSNEKIRYIEPEKEKSYLDIARDRDRYIQQVAQQTYAKHYLQNNTPINYDELKKRFK